MNITVGEGEVQEYDELSGFSPVDSSSAWDVLSGSADDLGAVDFNVKQDHVFLEPTSPTFADQADNSPQWGSSGSFAMVQPTCSSSSSVKRSMRDILREVKVSEEVLRGAVANLGGGAHGLRVLMDLVCFWTSSPEAQVEDMTATIRKGIVDLSNNVPPHHSAFDVNLQWKHYGTTGCDPKQRGSAYTRALRKSHIVRQRKHPPRAQRTSKQPCGHPYRGQWRNNEARQSWLHDLDPELGHDNGKGYEFLFQKELRASDVSSLGRIVLPKKDAERHLPFLVVREGMMISLEDYHSGTFWTARYRFWPNNKSRMYLLENIGGFVSFHRLQEGDFLLCYRNQQGGYVIRGQKVPASVRAPAKSLNRTGTTVAKETTTETASSEITTEMKTVDSTSQFMESGEHSATNTADSSSNSSFDSLECSFHPPAPSPVRYHNSFKTDLLKSGTYEPVVEMLLVSNVKHRFMEEDAT